MCESGRLLSTRLSAYDRLLSGDGVYKLMRLLNGVSKSSYYCSCSRGNTKEVIIVGSIAQVVAAFQ